MVDLVEHLVLELVLGAALPALAAEQRALVDGAVAVALRQRRRRRRERAVRQPGESSE